MLRRLAALCLLTGCHDVTPHPLDLLGNLADLTGPVAAVTSIDANDEFVVRLENAVSRAHPGIEGDFPTNDGIQCPTVPSLTATLNGEEASEVYAGGWDEPRGETGDPDSCRPPVVYFEDCPADEDIAVDLTDETGETWSIVVRLGCTPRTIHLATPPDGELHPGEPASIAGSVPTDTWVAIPDDFPSVYFKWGEGSDGWTSADATPGQTLDFTVPMEVASAQGLVELWPNHALRPLALACDGPAICEPQIGDWRAYGYGSLELDVAR